MSEPELLDVGDPNKCWGGWTIDSGPCAVCGATEDDACPFTPKLPSPPTDGEG